MNTVTEPDLFAPLDQPDLIDPNKDYLAELVGEDKKYKTPQDLAKKTVHQDAHIARIERENAGMREDLKARARLEEIADRITAASNRQPATNDDNQPGVNEGTGLTPEKLTELLERTLTEREKAARRANNLAAVKTRLHQEYGQGSPQKLREQAASLGLTEDYLNLLASEQPKAFFKLMGIEETTTRRDNFNLPSSSVNSEGFRPNLNGEKTQSYYRNLRKTKPSEYWSRAVQDEEMQNAFRLGEKFFDVS